MTLLARRVPIPRVRGRCEGRSAPLSPSSRRRARSPRWPAHVRPPLPRGALASFVGASSALFSSSSARPKKFLLTFHEGEQAAGETWRSLKVKAKEVADESKKQKAGGNLNLRLRAPGARHPGSPRNYARALSQCSNLDSLGIWMRRGDGEGRPRRRIEGLCRDPAVKENALGGQYLEPEDVQCGLDAMLR